MHEIKQGDITRDERTLLILVGSLVVPALLGSAATWGWISRWLVDKGVLVAASGSPQWVIPGAGGAGLDWARALLLVGVVLVGFAVLLTVARRLWERRELKR